MNHTNTLKKENPVNLTDYQIACRRTQNHDLTFTEQLINATLGLTGETLEYIHEHMHDAPPKKRVQELGDIMFYAAWLTDLTNQDLNELNEAGSHMRQAIRTAEIDSTPEQLLLQFIQHAGQISETVKKHVYHNNRTAEQVTEMIRTQVPRMLAWIEWVLPKGYTLNDAARLNNAKLLERYPNGFNPTPQ